MATLRSGGSSPAAAAAPASATTADAGRHWARHGTVLTACVVGINVLVILLIVFFFWRFFSGKPSSTAEEDEEEELPVASPWAYRLRRARPPPPPQDHDGAASLPVYVYSSAAAGATECAVCIVELRDGDAARQLPRCGHRFHAECVGAWLCLHATCPLCRASVVAPAAGAAETVNPKDAVAAAADDCPV